MADKVRLEKWKGFAKGDKVRCQRRPGMRSFPAVVQHIDIGPKIGVEIVVVGGKVHGTKGQHAIYTFRPEQLEKV